MTTLLPARAPPIDGESLLSVVRRSANAMGYDSSKRIIALLRETGTVPRWLNAIEASDTAERLADMLGLTMYELDKLTIHRYSAALTVTPATRSPPPHCDRKSRQQYFVSYPRVCPSCVSESETQADRILWSFRPVPICIQHGLPLVSLCPGCSPRHTDACLLNIERRHWTPLQENVSDRLTGKAVASMKRIVNCLENGDSLIPDTATPVSFLWLDQLACRVASCLRWLRHARSELQIPESFDDASLRWIVAADLITDWPVRFHKYLGSCHSELESESQSVRARHPFHGIHRVAVRLARRGHFEPARAIRNFLSQRHSNGFISDPGWLRRNRVVRDLLNRQEWLSHDDAATKLQLSVASVAGLISNGVIAGTVNHGRRCGQITGVASLESVEALIRELDSSLALDEAGAALGIRSDWILELIQGGVLSRCIKVGHDWKIPLSSIEGTLQLIANQPVLMAGTHEWIPANVAIQKYESQGSGCVEIVNWLNHKMVRGARLGGPVGFASLVVRDDDIVSQMSAKPNSRSNPTGIPLNRLTQTLFPGWPVTKRALQKWIDAELLTATQIGCQWYVLATDADHFRETYCIAAEAIRLINRHRNTLTRWESNGHLTPVDGPRGTPGAGFTLYRRADVERLKETWPVQRRRSIQTSNKNTSNPQRKEEACI